MVSHLRFGIDRLKRKNHLVQHNEQHHKKGEVDSLNVHTIELNVHTKFGFSHRPQGRAPWTEWQYHREVKLISFHLSSHILECNPETQKVASKESSIINSKQHRRKVLFGNWPHFRISHTYLKVRTSLYSTMYNKQHRRKVLFDSCPHFRILYTNLSLVM